MKKFLIKVNGNQYEVEVDEMRNDGSIIQQESEVRSAAPVTASVPSPAAVSAPNPNIPKAAATKKEAANTVAATTVTAPMPGTILSVNVKPEEVIKKGQVLVVLEAMKMENEIVSPQDGTIASVNTSKGTSVNAGDLLVSIA